MASWVRRRRRPRRRVAEAMGGGVPAVMGGVVARARRAPRAAIPGGGVNDTWKTIRLGRNADGTLDGSFTAEANESVFQGDVGWQGSLTGEGAIASDTTQPELRTRLTTFSGREDVRFPWDLIAVDAAEPLVLPEGGADRPLRVGAGDRVLPVAWTTTTTTWAGASAFLGYATDWTAASHGEPDPQLVAMRSAIVVSDASAMDRACIAALIPRPFDKGKGDRPCAGARKLRTVRGVV